MDVWVGGVIGMLVGSVILFCLIWDGRRKRQAAEDARAQAIEKLRAKFRYEPDPDPEPQPELVAVVERSRHIAGLWVWAVTHQPEFPVESDEWVSWKRHRAVGEGDTKEEAEEAARKALGWFKEIDGQRADPQREVIRDT